MQKISKVLIFILLHFKLAFCFELECRFVKYPDGYNCVMMTNLMANDRVTSVEGDHKENKNNENVASLYILYSSRTKYVPFGVCAHFKNLKQFDINGQRVMEITRNILDGCPNIVSFIVRNSRIKVIDVNLLENVKLLEHFTLDTTLVEYLPENFFKNNKKLKEVVMNGNKLKVINVIFPLTLTMLRLFSNQCINDGHISTDARSTPLSVLIEEIKNSCNDQTNITQLSTTQKIDTGNEQVIKLLEEKMNELYGYLASIQMSSTFTLLRMNRHSAITRAEFKLLDEPEYSLDTSDIRGQFENLKIKHETIERSLTDAILFCHQLETELRDFETLREVYNNFHENNTIENYMNIIFCIQILIIAFAAYITNFFFKNSS